MTIVEALAALTEGQPDRARALASADDSRLGRALSTYLGTNADGTVYDHPAAFQAFINGGGNVGFYAAVSAALAGVYDQERPSSLLDVGCGDGRALLPALAAGDRPDRLTLVEPSRALLDAAVRRLHIDHDAIQLDVHNAGVEQFIAGAGRFDVAQSTFALHALTPDVRDEVLAALARRVRLLVVVEFDVPELPARERLEFLASTYERGLGEYRADRDLVAQGFLMPVLTGQLMPGAARSTWEQPAVAWAAQMARAGFADVTTAPLFDYWSSPAFLLTASGTSRHPQ
jgi:SAM-dependent methyltransferase